MGEKCGNNNSSRGIEAKGSGSTSVCILKKSTIEFACIVFSDHPISVVLTSGHTVKILDIVAHS